MSPEALNPVAVVEYMREFASTAPITKHEETIINAAANIILGAVGKALGIDAEGDEWTNPQGSGYKGD